MKNQKTHLQTLQNLDSNSMVVVLSAPCIDENIYAEMIDDIIDFQAQFVSTLYGNDAVVLIADKKTLPRFRDKVPDNTLLEGEIYDIWVRDFSTVNPLSPLQFKYQANYLGEDPLSPQHTLPQDIQNSFNKFMLNKSFRFRQSDYVLDGGSIVDNYKGDIIISERFLTDNSLEKEAARTLFKEIYPARHVAIIPTDDDIMGHVDGVLMMVDDLVLVNRYPPSSLRDDIMFELTTYLPHIKIIEVNFHVEKKCNGFGSACGLNVNSLVTHKHIYIPVYGLCQYDLEFIDILKHHTHKTLHPIEAGKICKLGGSVRCLTLQLSISQGKQLVMQAAGRG